MRGFVRNGHAVVTHAQPANLGAWRMAIAARAAEARDAAGAGIASGPVALRAEFRLRRPRHHYGVRGVTPRWAGALPSGSVDLDKLLRALADALTGVLFVDDCQVVEVSAAKVYADSAGVDVTIAELPGRAVITEDAIPWEWQTTGGTA